MEYILLLVGFILLIKGADFFVEGSSSLAGIATKKGDSGLALGNAIGSNLFNILFILGMSAVISPLHVLGESVIDTVLLLGSAILLFVFARTGRRMTRSEGAVCVRLYVAYTAYLFVRYQCGYTRPQKSAPGGGALFYPIPAICGRYLSTGSRRR